MSDLSVVATLAAKPGTEKEVAAALGKLAAATRDEAGCISYEVFESASTPGTFVTIERWKGQSDLDAHMKSPHLAEALAEHGANLEVAIHPLKDI